MASRSQILLRRICGRSTGFLSRRSNVLPGVVTVHPADHHNHDGFSVRLHQQQRRWLSTPSAADEELIRVLNNEIEHEKQTDAVSQREIKSPPKPFTIVDQPGAQEVFLRRSYNNIEDIEVACLFQVEPYPEPPEEGDESEGAPSQIVRMTVKISKGGDDPYLEILCHTYGDEPVIEHVVYKEVSTGVKDLPYEGPCFEDLDSSVQKGFVKFLKARGINADLGSFLVNYMYHKEQLEYSRWLQNVKEFISGK